MAAESISLKEARKSPKLRERHFRPSDFLTTRQMDELHESNARGGRIERPFDEIDALSAEILGRFGWETYQAWLHGEIAQDRIMRYLAAERARKTAELYNLEALIVSSVAGANHPGKGGRTPKSLKQAIDVLRSEYKRSRGAQ